MNNHEQEDAPSLHTVDIEAFEELEYEIGLQEFGYNEQQYQRHTQEMEMSLIPYVDVFEDESLGFDNSQTVPFSAFEPIFCYPMP